MTADANLPGVAGRLVAGAAWPALTVNSTDQPRLVGAAAANAAQLPPAGVGQATLAGARPGAEEVVRPEERALVRWIAAEEEEPEEYKPSARAAEDEDTSPCGTDNADRGWPEAARGVRAPGVAARAVRVRGVDGTPQNGASA
mmetsp:Transcript_80905/g.203535  ORF Transcript_80905/g.203535 Transcript_80905/m.203535 type:complete len:143 (+) Transcript_80905:994-1422(+)